MSVSELNGTSILHDISPTKRSTDAIGISNQLTEMTITHTVPDWAEILDKADMPHDYFVTFATLLSTGTSLIMPFFMCRLLITTLANQLIPPADAAFIENTYLPELEKAVILI